VATVDPLVTKANAQMVNKEYEAALATIDRAIAKDPHAKLPLQIKSSILMFMRRNEDRLAVYDQILAIDPNDTQIHLARAHILTKVGRADEAIACGHWLIRRNPEPESYEHLAGIYLMASRRQEALATYDAGIAAFPNHPKSYSVKASYAHTMRQYPAAIALYDIAIRLAPHDDNLYWNRACSCVLGGDTQGALWSLAQVMRLKPSARERLMKDRDLKALHEHPEFIRMVSGG
jgi:tetratricopeptide (TPR) repeat protein